QTTKINYSDIDSSMIASSVRVLRPPGGGSNISLGADEEKPPVRKNKMASSVFAEPEDPYANRRNNPPGGKPTGVLCGEPSAPLRRGGNHATNHSADAHATVRSSVPEQQEEAPPTEEPAAGVPSGRRNPPGGKSSLILG
uniref:Jupiter microtubule associated homolog 1a n=1 Tax=Echeneis naucrates TaxID=173247 RepID=A0A665TGM9_ECHNA